MMMYDFKTYLTDDILQKVDRASMSVSLETRCPFLDPNIINCALSIPIDMKIKDNKLPNNFNKNDYNIAIFLTSEHERAYLNEFTENFPFKRQVDAVKYIADNLPNKYKK